MKLRAPPGRAGRLWLIHRLDVAGRGADVLDQKRQALQRQQRRLRALLDQTRLEWEEAARAAEKWWNRAAVLGGERMLDLACATSSTPAEVRVEWRNSLGVVHPAEAEVIANRRPAPTGSSALAYAASAHTRALEAAARFGAARFAHERTEAELRATALRLRALERRWIPEHERALAVRELALDEAEREDAMRNRWVIRRTGTRPGSEATP